MADGLFYAGRAVGESGGAGRLEALGRVGLPTRARASRPSSPAVNASEWLSHGPGRQNQRSSGRRADRQPGQRDRQCSARVLRGAQRGRSHHRRDHPRPGSAPAAFRDRSRCSTAASWVTSPGERNRSDAGVEYGHPDVIRPVSLKAGDLLRVATVGLRPAVCVHAFGVGNRHRGRSDRCGARPLRLLAGRPAVRDLRLGTNLLDGHQWADLLRSNRRAAEGGPRDDLSHRAGHRDAVHRVNRGFRLSEPADSERQHRRIERVTRRASACLAGRRFARGRAFLNAATAHEPVCRTRSGSSPALGIDRVIPGERVWVGHLWFYVVGILNPPCSRRRSTARSSSGFLPPGPTSASTDTRAPSTCGRPPTRWTRSLGARCDGKPGEPGNVDVSQPSDALTAQADAQGAFNDLFLGLGAVALLVGAVGVANIMVISVLERGMRSAAACARGDKGLIRCSSCPRRSC